MDFFAQQDQARRNTRYLIALFGLALILLIGLINALVTAFLWLMGDYNVYSGGSGWQGFVDLLSWERFALIGLAVIATVGLVSMIRWLQLASGGKVVAESMGGRRILRQSSNFHEQRCLNVIEELSLAANMPVPALYLLPQERGINAFAAGVSPSDAVVAVTRGTLLQLSREELQGVIGHEFSHILNGDMRLGIRLAALLKGITFIGDVGHFLLRAGAYGLAGRSRGRSESSAALPLLGLGLLIVGWLGSLSAGAIKAAISRQKEYLADASAVQFTRDNRGIADALKVIGGFLPGSLVHAARAAEMSHLFFSEATHHIWDGFATHPPLDRRISRLDGGWNGEFIQRSELIYGVEPLTENHQQAGVGREALVLAAMASLSGGGLSDPLPDAEFSPPHVASSDDAGTNQDRAPQALAVLHDASMEPLGAAAVALGMLVVRNRDQLRAALDLIRDQGPRGQSERLESLLPDIAALQPGQRFPLIASAMPALKSMSTPQYRQFKNTLLAVIRLDRQTDLFEWCLFQLLRHYLDPEYVRVEASRPRHRRLEKVRLPLRVVLSMLAYQGQGDSERAFRLGCKALGVDTLALLPVQDCDIASFSRAVHTLADCYPLLKPRILKAMAMAAADDGLICATERELIAAVAAVMDCPLPIELVSEADT